MKKMLYILISLMLLGLVIFKLKNNKEAAQSKIYHYDKDRPIMVQTDTLTLQAIDVEQSFTGVFEPEKEVKISTETQGKINSIFVDIGSYVKKGQPLIKIDDALLQLQLQSVTVQIEGLETDVKRFTVLTQADAIQGVQLEKAQLGLKAAKVQRNTILEQIAKTNVAAPFSGIVTAKFLETGAFAAPGVPLLQITDISRLRFTVNVPENDLQFFRPDQNYPVRADAYGEMNFTGKAVMIGSKSNMGNSFPVQFLLANTGDLKLKSGMFGKVLISEIHHREGLVIPATAVAGSDLQPQVYVVKNNKAILQNISIAQRIRNNIVVGGGLQPSDIIVTGGFINLYDGAAIAIKN